MRDTDVDWNLIGREQPFYGVITQSQYRTENLNESTRDIFWASGTETVASYAGVLKALHPGFAPKSALDFGCGVGRLTRPLAQLTGRAVGIDISEGMLERAREGAPEGVTFQKELPDSQFDWVNSFIVFQHIPPGRGYKILEELLRRTATGGYVSLHFTVYKDTGGQGMVARPSLSRWDGEANIIYTEANAEVGAMMMFDYDLSRIMAILHSGQIDNVYLKHTNHGGCHGVEIFGKRE